jgi:hypothetical protein
MTSSEKRLREALEPFAGLALTTDVGPRCKRYFEIEDVLIIAARTALGDDQQYRPRILVKSPPVSGEKDG